MNLKVIAFDADDTLLVNEPCFQETEMELINIKKMKKYLIACLCVISQINYSQEKVGSINYEIENSRGIYSIVDEQEKKVLLIFNDKTKIDFIALDETFKQLGKISIIDESKGKNDYLGYSKNNQTYYTYWRDSKEENIEVKEVHLDKNTVTTSKISFVLEKEIIFNTATINNIFYVLSIKKNTDILNIYTFKDGEMNKKSIDNSNLKFINSENRSICFSCYISKSITIYSSIVFRI